MYDWKKKGDYQLLGETFMKLNEIKKATKLYGWLFYEINAHSYKKKKMKAVGRLNFSRIKFEVKHVSDAATPHLS